MFQSKFLKYSVYTGLDSLSMLKHFIDNRKYLIICDTNTEKFCLPQLQKWLSNFDINNVLVIKSGEENKNLITLNKIWQFLLKKNTNHNHVIINLGGGVVTDIGSFAAATFHRGISYIQIPTTLLAQVDASIGNKTGFNFEEIKNCVGLFSNPVAVLNNPAFISTLNNEQIRSGFGEIFKHALIADKNYWDSLKKNNTDSQNNLLKMISVSVEIKKNIINIDPQDMGVRKILNCGHTVGHALETFFLMKNKHIQHGDAVAAGLIIESFIANKINLLNYSALTEIINTLCAFFPKIIINEVDFSQIIAIMNFDKKNKSNSINFSLLEDIGKACFDVYINDLLLIKSALIEYNKL